LARCLATAPAILAASLGSPRKRPEPRRVSQGSPTNQTPGSVVAPVKGRKRHLLVDTEDLVLKAKVHSAKIRDFEKGSRRS
jgi:hypothetical protein